MLLKHIEISHFRNLQSVKLTLPETGYCIISGSNGSGKTSLLEAIYTLSCGKSFRTAESLQLIQNDAENFVLFAEMGYLQDSRSATLLKDTLANVGATGGRPFQTQIADPTGASARDLLLDSTTSLYSSIPIGIQRDRTGKIIAKCAGESAKFSDIARMLPTRIISPIESYTLINGGPEQRRRFLDWGMFHVKHFYWTELKKLYRIIKQKNAALKMRCSDEELVQWNHMLAEVSYSLDALRSEYMLKLKDLFSKYRENLPALASVELEYYAGWDNQSTDLFTQLSTVLRQERQQGHCLLGPHRAEIRLHTQHGLCKDQLSRGRQKTLAIALYLAQGELLYQETGRHPLYMIDDFSSELDIDAQQLLINSLNPQDKQIIVTLLDQKSGFFDDVISENYRYTLSQGELREI